MSGAGNGGNQPRKTYLGQIGEPPPMPRPLLHNIPHVLRMADRGCVWRWGPVWEETEKNSGVMQHAKKPDGTPRWTKMPHLEGTERLPSGHPLKDGHSRSTALSWAQMVTQVERGGTWVGRRVELGAGIVTGTLPGEQPYVIVDLDWKGYSGYVRDGRLDRVWGGLPAPVVALLKRFCGDLGCYWETSPSGQGGHLIIPGTLPEGHHTRFSRLPARLGGWGDQVDVEVYSTRRWLTLTGITPIANSADLPMEPSDELQRELDGFYRALCKTAGKSEAPALATSAGQAISVQSRAVPQLPADQLTGALAVFGSEKLAPLWNGTLPGDQSRLDYRLALTLFEVLGDEPQQVADALASSGRWRGKFDVVHVRGETYLSATVSNARNQWLSNGSKRFGTGEQVGQLTSPTWTDEQLDALVAHVFAATKGSSLAKNAMAGTLKALLDLHRQGESHVHDGRILVHTGGLLGLARVLGGRTPVIMQRLEWLAAQGYIASAGRDARGQLQVALFAGAADCLALQEGLRRPELSLPSNPHRPRPTTRAERAGSSADSSAAVPLGEMARCQWTMWSIHAGARTPAEIAEHTNAALRTVRAHLATLQRAGMVTADLEPDISRELYAASVIAERRLGQVKTEEHRQRATALWREYNAKRGQTQPISAARTAELNAWESVPNVQFTREMQQFDAWLSNAAD